MNFLQFFVWGSWLISLGGYMERGLHFEGPLADSSSASAAVRQVSTGSSRSSAASIPFVCPQKRQARLQRPVN